MPKRRKGTVPNKTNDRHVLEKVCLGGARGGLILTLTGWSDHLLKPLGRRSNHAHCICAVEYLKHVLSCGPSFRIYGKTIRLCKRSDVCQLHLNAPLFHRWYVLFRARSFFGATVIQELRSPNLNYLPMRSAVIFPTGLLSCIFRQSANLCDLVQNLTSFCKQPYLVFCDFAPCLS